MKNFRVGDILVDKETENAYRIICLAEDLTVVCRMQTTRLDLFEIPTKEIVDKVIDGDLLVQEKENIVFDSEKLSAVMKAKYALNKQIINEVQDYYGPTYMQLMGNSTKYGMVDIQKKYNVSRLKCSRLILRYLQSGMDDSSLVDPRAIGRVNYKEYEYKKRPGRQSDSGYTSTVIVDDEIKKQFDSAIEVLKKDRHQTVESAYSWLCNKYYIESRIIDGEICFISKPEHLIPTMKQFRNYVTKKLTPEEKDVLKTSAREVRNDKRLLDSDALFEVYGPGDMVEVDAVEVDLSIVSELDRNKTVGRPIMYVMIDVFTRMILAMSVAFDNNSVIALTSLLMNLADDKVKYCEKYGFSIDENAWISGIIPRHMRIDRGADFKSDKFAKILQELGIDRQLVSAASGSLKGTIEQEFRSLHYAIKPHLSNNGVITQRHDSKHHKKATLTITEFTAMAIDFVLNHNQMASESYPLTADMIRCGVHPNPQELWKYGCKKYGQPRPISNKDAYYYALMTPVNAKIDRTGIRALGLYYMNFEDVELRAMMYRLQRNVKTIEMRYDPRDISNLYYLSSDSRMRIAPLNLKKTGMNDYVGMTECELKEYKKREKELRAESSRKNREIKNDMYAQEKMIAQTAISNSKGVSDSEGLRDNRSNEKLITQYKNRVATRIEKEDTDYIGKSQVSLVKEKNEDKDSVFPVDDKIQAEENAGDDETNNSDFETMFNKFF